MRVLQVNSVCGRGSTGRIATGIATRLAERGDECTIAYGRDEGLGWEDTYRIGGKIDEALHLAQARLLDHSGFGSTRATKKFLEWLDTQQFDLIHLHNVHGYYLDVEVLFEALKRRDTPVLWTLHDCWTFTGHCAYYDFAGCTRWQDHCGDCPELASYPKAWIDNSPRNLARKKAAFSGVENLTLVSPSRWLRDQAMASFLSQYPCEVVPNEIDTETFVPTPSDFRARHGLEGKTVILGVANIWERRKGLEHLLAFAPMLREDERLVIVGLDGDQRKDLPAGIIGLGRTASTKELAEVYTACDVFVNPTLEDISSLTNLEAVSVGRPVVCFNSGGAPETIEGMVGVVTDDRTAAGLRAAVDAALALPGSNEGVLQTRLAGRKAYESYLTVYDRILGAER